MTLLNPADESDHQYWSTDSAPASLTRPLSVWTAPYVLVLFTIFATLGLGLMTNVPWLASAFPARDLIFSPYSGDHSIPLRLFILSFYAAFSAGVGAGFTGRLRFFFELGLYFVMLCGAFDLVNLLADAQFGFVYSLHAVEILSGLFGFFVFSAKLLDHGSMPVRAEVPYQRRGKWRAIVTIILVAALAMSFSLWVDSIELPLIFDLRSAALLGGTGPGIFLFLPMFFFVLYVAGTVRAMFRRRTAFTPPVTIIIPAHNEAHVIGRTLAAIDRSAENYPGEVTVIVLNNCSTDQTVDKSLAALVAANHFTGRIVEVPVPGKSIALNRGIAETATPFMIRIDADTQVLPDTLTMAMRHFADEKVGVVGGLPLAPGDGPFDRARNLETLLKHGYYQVAYGAVDVIVGVPGMFAAYRTVALRSVGGFVTGMNGEDTDASLRIGELGHRIIGDPLIRYVSEVPRTIRHLREQRMRWFRSAYHVTARNMDYLDKMMPSARGKIMLPFMLLNSGRRAMTVALLIFGVLNLVVAPNPESTLTAQAVLAVMLGAPTLMVTFAALANGRIAALAGVPEYVVFRMYRAYLTLESVLSIAHRTGTEPRKSAPAENSAGR